VRQLVGHDLGEAEVLLPAVVRLPPGQRDLGRHTEALLRGRNAERSLLGTLGLVQLRDQRRLRCGSRAHQLLQGSDPVDTARIVEPAG
jgi:hypothetical protein